MVSFGNYESSQLFMTLNSSPLCAEPDLAEMITEWGHQKVSSMLKDVDGISIDDIPSTFDDLITKYIECIREGTMQPSTQYSLLEHPSVMQSIALYILNLITIRTLLGDTWRIKCDKWYFLSQFIKLYANECQFETELTKSNNLSILHIRRITAQIHCNLRNSNK